MPFGQAVDGIVEEQDVEIDIAAQRVEEVIAADRQQVAITTDDPDVDVGIGHCKTGRHCGRAAVDRVEAKSIDVVGKARCAADARDEDDS